MRERLYPDGTYELTQGIDNYLNYARDRASNTTKFDKPQTYTEMAEIPSIVVEKWKNENGFDLRTAGKNEVRKWLSKPENRVFLTNKKLPYRKL